MFRGIHCEQGDTRDTPPEEHFLSRFKERGFFLIDATDTPIAGMASSEKRGVLERDRLALQNKVRVLVDREVPIVLVTHSVWKTHRDWLLSAGCRVAHEVPIPHPAFGHQAAFHKRLSAVIEGLSLSERPGR